MIDIVIPIYNAPDDLRRCVQSVLAHTPPESYRLTLIDDGSPDPRVAGVLDEIRAQTPAIRILANEKNLGFTLTVNRGFAQTQSDVLLLNSDTIVTPGWLAAMVRALHSDHRVATVTPFSNHAEIASLPRWLEANPVLSDADAALMAQACADVDADTFPDLPTGVGFCMLMRRAAIEAIGVFDAETFGRGYGEENDWCQRAIKANWRNVLCVGAYVSHTGSQSFSSDKAALVQRNIVKLNEKHPAYDLRVQQFIAHDSIAPFRAAVISRFRALKERGRPGVLHLLHGKGGGLERHARDLMRLRTEARHYVLLALGEHWSIEDHSGDVPQTYSISHQTDELWAALLADVCERFCVSIIHVHHISACREGLRLALAESRIPYVVTLHDFYYVCPAIHLLRADDSYCGGETDTSACQRCVNSNPALPKIDVAVWRRENEAFLLKAMKIYAPSKFVSEMCRKFWPDLAISVVPHHSDVVASSNAPKVNALARAADSTITLAVVGAIGPLKGARIVEAMAHRVRERGLDVRIVVIGYLDRQISSTVKNQGKWIVHGEFSSSELPALLEAYGAKLALFPAIGPETFGFVLSEVWSAGVYPIVSDVGALADRVRSIDGGSVLRVPTSAVVDIDYWIDEAVGLAQPANSGERESRIRAGRRAVALDDQSSETTEIYEKFASSERVDQRTRGVSARNQNRRWVEKRTKTGAAQPRASGIHIYALKLLVMSALRVRHTRVGRYLESKVPPTAKRRLRTLVFLKNGVD